MSTNETALRAVVSLELDRHLQGWAERHPHLAAAIDRVQLIELAVASLRDEPAFLEAMRRADLDEHRLAEAARLLRLAEGWIGRALPG